MAVGVMSFRVGLIPIMVGNFDQSATKMRRVFVGKLKQSYNSVNELEISPCPLVGGRSKAYPCANLFFKVDIFVRKNWSISEHAAAL